MNKIIQLFFATLWLPLLALANPFSELYYYRSVEPSPTKIWKCDLAVYGGSPAGVGAAIQASKMGKKVLFFSFNDFVGGLTSGGLTATDVGRKKSIGGLAKEFYKRVGRIRDFSPSEAEKLYLQAVGKLNHESD